jgi:cysteine desulfurase
MNNKLNNKRIYLDYASSTPVNKDVLKHLLELESKIYGNPSSIHKEGLDAHTILEESRKVISSSLGCHKDEITFTSSGTESNNLAIMGVVFEFKKKYPKIRPHIIISEVEHPSVYEVVENLNKVGLIEYSTLAVDNNGFVKVKELKNILKSNTILVSVILANNEIGTIEPVEEISKTLRHYKKHRKDNLFKDIDLNFYPLLHTDACQYFVYKKIFVEKLGVDLLSINSSKIYSPKGVGVLYVKRLAPISAILFGGGQEKNKRSSTENIPLISSFAKAVLINEKIKLKESERIKKIRDYLIKGLYKIWPDLFINGDMKDRLPNNLNITIPKIMSEKFVIYSDAFNISISEKSACKSENKSESSVLKAIRKNTDTLFNKEEGSLRFSLGKYTEKKDIDEVLKRFKEMKKII